MTSQPQAAASALLRRVGWLTDRGAQAMKVAALASWAGAIGATLVVFSKLGAGGWLIGAATLIPGWFLWNYGKALGSSLDIEKIRGQLGNAVGVAKDKVGEVVEGIRSAKTSKLRGVFQVLRTVRSIRGELSAFGVDISGIAQVATPASIALVGASALFTVGLWLVFALGLVARMVF